MHVPELIVNQAHGSGKIKKLDKVKFIDEAKIMECIAIPQTLTSVKGTVGDVRLLLALLLKSLAILNDPQGTIMPWPSMLHDSVGQVPVGRVVNSRRSGHSAE